jgi:hypothetical protein
MLQERRRAKRRKSRSMNILAAIEKELFRHLFCIDFGKQSSEFSVRQALTGNWHDGEKGNNVPSLRAFSTDALVESGRASRQLHSITNVRKQENLDHEFRRKLFEHADVGGGAVLFIHGDSGGELFFLEHHAVALIDSGRHSRLFQHDTVFVIVSGGHHSRLFQHGAVLLIDSGRHGDVVCAAMRSKKANNDTPGAFRVVNEEESGIFPDLKDSKITMMSGRPLLLLATLSCTAIYSTTYIDGEERKDARWGRRWQRRN